MPKVSVVITTHNRGSQLKTCLWSIIANATVRPDEISIVDDRSHDNTPRMIYESVLLGTMWHVPFKCHVITGEDGWRSPAIPRNIAIRNTSPDADYLWFLEPEMLLMPITLEAMLKKIVPGCWVNLTRQGFMHRPLSDEEKFKPDLLWQHLGESDIYRDPAPHLAVRCALVPREAVFRIRGMDEGFEGWGHDDTSMMSRLDMADCKMISIFDVPIIHQAHEMAPANAITANKNLARLQEQQAVGNYAPNREDWGIVLVRK